LFRVELIVKHVCLVHCNLFCGFFIPLLNHLYDFLLAFNSTLVVGCVDFPWHSFFLGTVKCFWDHFPYSVKVGDAHLCSFVFGFDVIVYLALYVGNLFVIVQFLFLLACSHSRLFELKELLRDSAFAPLFASFFFGNFIVYPL
jgi:hypothetical protein